MQLSLSVQVECRVKPTHPLHLAEGRSCIRNVTSCSELASWLTLGL